MPTTLKLVVLGTAGVGKSCMIIQYVEKSFASDYEPTISNLFEKDVQVKNRTYHATIQDTAGMETSISLRENATKNRDCYLLIYSIDDRASFEEITSIHNELLRTNSDPISCVVIGNKNDISDESREVSYEEGEKLAKSLDATFIETSAKTNCNIEEAFQIALELAVQKYPQQDPSTKPKHRCILL